MFNLVMGIVMIGIGTICLVKGCVGTLSPVMIFFGCCMIVFGIVEIIRSKAIRKREQQRKESKEFMDDLTTRDQRMMFGILTMVHTAESKKQLDADTETLLTIGRKKLCQFSVLKFQQMDGLNTALPIGHRKIPAVRTLTSESVAVLMPFRVQEIMDAGGIYCGENAISHNLIMCNKEKLLNPNSFLLGVPGSGKSFNAKMQIVFLALATQDDILICDPEREYASLVEAMGGEVVRQILYRILLFRQ